MATRIFKVSKWRTKSGSNPIGVYTKNQWLYATLTGDALKDCTIDKITIHFPALRCTFQPAGELRMKFGGVTVKQAIGSSGGNRVERSYNMHGATDNMFANGGGEVIFYAYQGSGEGYLSIDDAAVTVTVEYTPKASELLVPSKVVKAGEQLSFSISPYNSAYHHEAIIQMDDRAVNTSIPAGTTDGAITVPLDWLELMPNTQTRNDATLSLYTFKPDGTLLGEKTVSGITVNAPFYMPQMKYSWEKMLTVDGVTYPDPGMYVQGKFGIRAEITEVEGYYGSEATATIYIDGKAHTGPVPLVVETGLITRSSISIQFEVTDSRGAVFHPRGLILVVTPYTPPQASLTAYRADAAGDGSPDDMSARGRYAYTYYVDPLNGKNTHTIKLSVDGVTETDPPTEGWLLPSEFVGLDTTSSHDVTLTVSDVYETVTRTFRIPSAAFMLHFNAEGNGAGIGQAAEKAQALMINPEWDVWGKGGNLTEIISGQAQLIASQAETIASLGATVAELQQKVDGMSGSGAKLLWSGTWSVNTSKTIPGISDWQVLQINTSNGIVWAFDAGTTIQGGGFNIGAGVHRSVGVRVSVSGDTCTLAACHLIRHNASSNHDAFTDVTISAVYGIIRNPAKGVSEDGN